MDVKQGINKAGNTVLYLVFEYMDTDLKKFIRSFRQTGENIPSPTVKVSSIWLVFRYEFCLKCLSDWFFWGLNLIVFWLKWFLIGFLIIDVELDVSTL